jgi:transposase-like protein
MKCPKCGSEKVVTGQAVDYMLFCDQCNEHFNLRQQSQIEEQRREISKLRNDIANHLTGAYVSGLERMITELREGLTKLHSLVKLRMVHFDIASSETPEDYDIPSHAVVIELEQELAKLIGGSDV